MKSKTSKTDSILMDLSIKQTEPSIELNNYSCSSLATASNDGNSHRYRSDRPLVRDFKNYERLLAEINETLKRSLNERQYYSVILYFNHAKVTINDVAECLNYDSNSISNAIAKARRVVNVIL